MGPNPELPPNPLETADLVTFTEEVFKMENFIFCAVLAVKTIAMFARPPIIWKLQTVFHEGAISLQKMKLSVRYFIPKPAENCGFGHSYGRNL